MVYLLENTCPRERVNPHVKKAVELVEAFLGSCALMDSADHGPAAHRVRLYWTSMLPIEVVRR